MLYEVITRTATAGTCRATSVGATGAARISCWNWSPRITSYNVCYTKLLRGIEPFLAGRRIRDIRVREPRLRWPVNREVEKAKGRRVTGVTRRAKYILVHLDDGNLLIHSYNFV